MLTVILYICPLLFGEGGTFAPGQGTFQAPVECDDWTVMADLDGTPSVYCHGAENAETVTWNVWLFKVWEAGEKFGFSHENNAIRAGQFYWHGLYEVYVLPAS